MEGLYSYRLPKSWPTSRELIGTPQAYFQPKTFDPRRGTGARDVFAAAQGKAN